MSHDRDAAPSFILRALEISGTEVIAPGVQEVAFGLEKLRQMMDKSSIQVISANLPGFMPYTLLSKNKGRTKVLVTSVVDPELLIKNESPAKGIMDPVAALQSIQEQIPHDLFVVIMHAEPSMISSVIEKCPGIDLIIDGMNENFPKDEGHINPPQVVAKMK